VTYRASAAVCCTTVGHKCVVSTFGGALGATSFRCEHFLVVRTQEVGCV
jgi:hypothetical protein